VESNSFSNLSKEQKDINKNSEQQHCGSIRETSVLHSAWDYIEIKERQKVNKN
jgi:hypothetical protein